MEIRKKDKEEIRRCNEVEGWWGTFKISFASALSLIATIPEKLAVSAIASVAVLVVAAEPVV